MIRFTHGDIFAQPAEAIVNPVNCVGVAGAGLALKFRRHHPDAFLAYARTWAEEGERLTGPPLPGVPPGNFAPPS